MGGRKDWLSPSCCGSDSIRYGTTFRSDVWRSLDPCGLLCLSISVLLHIFAIETLGTKFLKHSTIGQYLYYCLYIPFTLLALWSLYVSYTTDPGCVPMGAKPIEHPSYRYEGLQQHQVDDIESNGHKRHKRHYSFDEDADDDDASDPNPLNQTLQFHAPIPMVRSEESNTSRLSVDSQLYSIKSKSSADSAMSQSKKRKVRLATPSTVRRCRKCHDNYKPSRAHHDNVTGRCIIDMDHYCPWVGNVIGLKNRKHVLLFLLYSFLCTCVAIPIVILKFMSCNEQVEYANDNMNHRVSMMVGCQKLLLPTTMILVILVVLFFCFTSCMLVDQYMALKSQKKYATHGFSEIFGTNGNDLDIVTAKRMKWHWFLPLQVTYPSDRHEYIMGYRTAEAETGSAWRPVRLPGTAKYNEKYPTDMVQISASLGNSSITSHSTTGSILKNGNNNNNNNMMNTSHSINYQRKTSIIQENDDNDDDDDEEGENNIDDEHDLVIVGSTNLASASSKTSTSSYKDDDSGNGTVIRNVPLNDNTTTTTSDSQTMMPKKSLSIDDGEFA